MRTSVFTGAYAGRGLCGIGGILCLGWRSMCFLRLMKMACQGCGCPRKCCVCVCVLAYACVCLHAYVHACLCACPRMYLHAQYCMPSMLRAKLHAGPGQQAPRLPVVKCIGACAWKSIGHWSMGLWSLDLWL